MSQIVVFTVDACELPVPDSLLVVSPVFREEARIWEDDDEPIPIDAPHDALLKIFDYTEKFQHEYVFLSQYAADSDSDDAYAEQVIDWGSNPSYKKWATEFLAGLDDELLFKVFNAASLLQIESLKNLLMVEIWLRLERKEAKGDVAEYFKLRI